MTAFNIREATEDDMFDLLFIIKNFYEKDMVTKQRLDVKHLTVVIEKAIASPDWYSKVIEDDSGIKGLMAGFVGESILGTELIANEAIWAILEEERGNGFGDALFKNFEEWAEEKGAVYIAATHLVNNTYTKDILESRGFEEAEVTYLRKVG